MDQYPLSWRVALSQVLGSLIFCLGVLAGPADSIPRALAAGAFAGTAASALAGFRFPGWPWFSVGLASCLAGSLRQHWGLSDWPLHMLWSLSAMLGWVLIWPLAQAFLIQVFGVETQAYENAWEGWPGSRLPPLLRGALSLLLSCLGTTVLLLLLGPAAGWLAAVAWWALAIWITHGCAGSRPEWQLVGAFFGVGLLLLLPSWGLDSPVQRILGPCDPYWLLGQACLAIPLGYWVSQWNLREILQWGQSRPPRIDRLIH